MSERCCQASWQLNEFIPLTRRTDLTSPPDFPRTIVQPLSNPMHYNNMTFATPGSSCDGLSLVVIGLLVFPAEAGTHFRHGHRPEPVLGPAGGRTRGPV